MPSWATMHGPIGCFAVQDTPNDGHSAGVVRPALIRSAGGPQWERHASATGA